MAFKLHEKQIHPVKIVAEVPCPTRDTYPFDITDPIQPWNVPYVVAYVADTMNIYSFLTGQKVFSVLLGKYLGKSVSSGYSVDGIVEWRGNIIVWSKVENLLYQWVE